MANTPLRRSREQKMLGGLIGGIAEYFDQPAGSPSISISRRDRRVFRPQRDLAARAVRHRLHFVGGVSRHPRLPRVVGLDPATRALSVCLDPSARLTLRLTPST
jgi:hypothetical protein